jgi:hypothetical protein
VGDLGATVPGIPTGSAFLARSLGPAVIGGTWRAHWLYWLAPISAMIVSARVYDMVRATKPPPVGYQRAVVGIQGPVTQNSVASFGAGQS